MMNVLHVMGRMAAGGTEHQLLGMLESAHRRHWEATLCVLSSGWELSERVRSAGVPVIELDGLRKTDPRRALALRRLARSFDLVHASLPGASAFARIVASGHRRPAFVVSERGAGDDRVALGLVSRLLQPMTDAFIGNSPAVIDFLRRTSGLHPTDSRLAVIPNGLDGAVFHPARRWLPSHDNSKRMVAVGRLVSGKRFDRAISLLPTLSDEFDIELTIVGDGPERRRLESLAKGKRVSFVGHVSDRDSLAEILRGSDVLLMPSASEGYPNAVIEALACGIPVVASDIPGNQAVGGAGVSLVGDSDDKWSAAVRVALARGPVAAADVADRILTFDEVARRHLSVFEAAMTRRHHRSALGRFGPAPNSGFEL